MSVTKPANQAPSDRTVQEAIRIVEVALGNLIATEVTDGGKPATSRQAPRWMGERYGLGMAAPQLRGKQLVPALHRELVPIMRRPLDPAKGYTAEARIDEILVALGGLCVIFGCNPLAGARLRALRAQLGRLFAA